LPLTRANRNCCPGSIGDRLVGCGHLDDAQIVDQTLSQGFLVGKEQFHEQGFRLPYSRPLVSADALVFFAAAFEPLAYGSPIQSYEVGYGFDVEASRQ